MHAEDETSKALEGRACEGLGERVAEMDSGADVDHLDDLVLDLLDHPSVPEDDVASARGDGSTLRNVVCRGEQG